MNQRLYETVEILSGSSHHVEDRAAQNAKINRLKLQFSLETCSIIDPLGNRKKSGIG